MSKIPEDIRQKLASVCTDMQDFIKLGNLLISCQVGPEIAKQAALATDKLVAMGRVRPEDRNQMVEQLTFTPASVIAGLQKMAEANELIKTAGEMTSLGTPIMKQANQVGTQRKSEEIWSGGFRNLA